MPPEMVRPVAIVSISDIAIIARRLGMRWVDFRPEDNTMRAEGNGHVLNSTLVRSIGLILQYMRVGDPFSLPLNGLYIPTREVDAMGFGILPESELITLMDFIYTCILVCISHLFIYLSGGEAEKKQERQAKKEKGGITEVAIQVSVLP